MNSSSRKSSYSGNGGGNCVDVTYLWRKSSYSGNGGGSCVQVAGKLPHVVAVRDSKDPSGPTLFFTPREWAGFVARIRSGV